MEGVAARWLDRAPAAWDALIASDPAAAPSHRPELWAAFTATNPSLSLRFAAVERDGVLVGGAPALIERRGGLHWVHALPMLLNAAPLASAGEREVVDAAVAGAIASLAESCGAAGGEWALHRPGATAGDAEALARAAEPVGGETRWLEASIVDLSQGIDAAAKRVSRKHRQSMRQSRDRGLVFAEEPGALEGVYALHLSQSRAWGAHRPQPLALSRALLAHGAARLFTLRRNGELLSGTLALDGAHESFAWWSGTHPEGRRLNAFPLLLWSVAEWAAGAGRTRFNLGASTGLQMVASFKSALGATTERYPVRWLDARHAPAPARALAALQSFVRRGREFGAKHEVAGQSDGAGAKHAVPDHSAGAGAKQESSEAARGAGAKHESSEAAHGAGGAEL